MNKLELVEHVATEAELTKVSAAAALEAVLDGIAKSLKKGDEVRLVGFGTFSVRERAAGKGRNPATGKEIKIAASKNARFKAGAALKSSLNIARSRRRSRLAHERSGRRRLARGAAASAGRIKVDRGRVPQGSAFCWPIGARACTVAARLSRNGRRSRAVSSVGRASRLHREGRRFEPVTAHQTSGRSRA